MKIILLLLLCLQVKAQIQTDNGIEYAEYDEPIYDNQFIFYKKPYFTEGEVWYFGRHYNSTPLKFDLVRNTVVTLHTSFQAEISLYYEQLDSFKIFEDTFIKYPQIEQGYFCRAFTNSKYLLLIKYSKSTLRQQYENGGIYSLLSSSEAYFLVYKGEIYKIKSLRELAKTIKESTKNLKYLENKRETYIQFLKSK